MKSYLFLDVESTGLNSSTHDIVQLACIPIIDGKMHQEFNEFCQPFNFNTVDPGAVAVHGITVDQMRTFQTPQAMIEKFIDYVSQFNVKFVISGYNSNFDKSFLGSFFAKNGRTREYSKLFLNEVRDVYARAKAVKSQLKSTKFKLVNLAEEFGIEIKAHDALSDIRATIEVDKKLSALIGEDFEEVYYKDDKIDLNLPELPQLHIHSEYSNTDSVSSIEEWVYWAYSNGVKALAFPDHNWAVSLFKSTNLKSVLDKTNKSHKTNITESDVTLIPAISINVIDPENGLLKPFRLNAWAISNDGYKNLIKLSSLGWKSTIDDCDVAIPVLQISEVLKLQKGVVFGTACEKGIFSYVADVHDNASIEDTLSKVNALIGRFDRVLLELLPFDVIKYFDKGLGFRNYSKSNMMPDGNLTRTINNTIMDIADKTGLKFIISTAAHFIHPDDKVFQDVVSKSSFKDKRFFYDTRYQRSLNESFAILKRHLGERFTLNHVEAARSAAQEVVDAAKIIRIKNDYHLPRIEIPAAIAEKTQDYDKQLYLLLMSKIKEHGRWSDDPEYVARFKKELDVIWKNSKLNFIPYFLMYEDICSYARSQGILQNLARGSAGGCLISYYLKIIHIDPIKNNLPFERFLSHARINASSFPDIDLDLGQRGPVLKYLVDKYKGGFAQIGTFQRFKTKNAIKDAMFAVFGRNRADKEIMDVCDTIPDSPQGLDEDKFLHGYTDSEGVTHKGHLEQNEMLQIFFRQYPEIERITNKLIGLPKGMGRHASAFVISTLDISGERVPTMVFDDPDIGQVAVTQFEAPMVEKCGLVKADVLGLTTVKTLENVVSLIKSRTGVDLLEEDDKGVQMLYRLPEDNKVYEDFYKRKTDSAFQFNTDLIKSYIQKFAPIKRQDLSDLTALCRPGALDVEFKPGISATQFYVDVRNGICEPEYIHEDLAEILSETNGVVVYQEQLMEILVKFCGYSLEESDQIRSAIAKKKRDVMLKAFDRIRSETTKKGWTIEQANRLCDVVTAYSNYSFNRSHSCLAPEQKVQTPDGPIRVCDLKPGDLVIGATPEGAKICTTSNVWVVGEKEVFEIKFDDGSVVNATEDHLIASSADWISFREAFDEQCYVFLCNNLKSLKIKSMKPIGKMPVYDIEVPDTRNFVLDNGVIAHNCAYANLGYITMYLKHHYPLEWWTAELNNSDENKIRHYVTILGDTITPPSLHAPDDKFTIVGNRIAAPLSAVKGLGPASIKAIISRGPYSSVEEFIERMSGSVNSSHFWALLKAGVFDEMAPINISIPEARVNFINLLKKAKKIKNTPPEVSDNSPLNIFLNQRDAYKCFNKALLLDPLIRSEISAVWPSMRETKRKDIPFAFGSAPTVPVIASIAIAEKLLLSQERSENSDRVRVAMVGLFQSSSHKSGISKRGKPWSKVDVVLSDGISNIECVQWDQKRALRYSVNSLVYVMGYIKRGWRGSATIEILEIEKLEKFNEFSKKISQV